VRYEAIVLKVLPKLLQWEGAALRGVRRCLETRNAVGRSNRIHVEAGIVILSRRRTMRVRVRIAGLVGREAKRRRRLIFIHGLQRATARRSVQLLYLSGSSLLFKISDCPRKQRCMSIALGSFTSSGLELNRESGLKLDSSRYGGWDGCLRIC